MLRRVLIANRGEIAVRIIRTCRELGVETVAICSTEDKDALHTQLATRTVCVGPAKAADSYLNQQAILAAALGVLFLLRPAFILSVTSDILGIYIAIDSLINLKRATELYRLNYRQWWVSLLLSLAGIVMALVILFYPFQTQLLLFRVIGGVFAYTGVSDLWALFKVSRLTRELRKRAPIEVDPIDIE